MKTLTTAPCKKAQERERFENESNLRRKNHFKEGVLPKSWLSLPQCQAELWRKKEWLYYLARQKVRLVPQKLCPFSLVSKGKVI